MPDRQQNAKTGARTDDAAASVSQPYYEMPVRSPLEANSVMYQELTTPHSIDNLPPRPDIPNSVYTQLP